MCRVYQKGNRQYVRLCYRFGSRRGEKVYFDGSPPIGLSGHYVGRTGHGSRGGGVRNNALTFHVPLWAIQAEIDDMARYAGAKQVSVDGQLVTFSGLIARGRDTAIVKRARTFGWREVKEV